MWEWGEGMEAFIATCRSALDRMQETRDVVFTCSSAAHYRWVEQVDPDLFRQIQERVAEGRWEVVGGWWTQADCNLPSGEGFVRQALLGQRYFVEKFGKPATVGYSPDAFGHNAGLPQLLSGAGLSSYIFCRPDPNELQLPSPLFRWFSPDGSSVLAYRVPLHYNMYQTTVPKKIKDIARAFNEPSDLAADNLPLSAFGKEWAVFYGVGNHGGGPTKEHIQQIIAANNDPAQPDVQFGRLDYFFKKTEAEEGRIVPEWKDDLQLNAPGCYSVHATIKKLNRRAENELIRAETLAVMESQLLLQSSSDAVDVRTQRITEQIAAFRRAWENVCFNHFHDILCGVAVPEALDNAVLLYGEALAIADRISRYALRRIASRIDSTVHSESSGQTLVVFNPNGFELDQHLTFELWHDIDKELWGRPVHLRVTDDAGNDLAVGAVQSVGKIGKDRVAGTFQANVPAMGWRCYRVHYGQESPFSNTQGLIEASNTVLENEFLRVEFSAKSGGILKLLDKESGLDFIDSTDNSVAAMFAVIRDETDTWGHGVERFNDVIGMFNQAEVQLVENTPTHGTVRVKARWGSSQVQQDFTLFAGEAVLHARARVLQAEPRTMLKLTFPTSLVDTRSVVEAAYTSTEKPCDGIERPCGAWKSIVGNIDGKIAGLGIADSLIHGYSADGGTLSLTVLRSPSYATHDPHIITPNQDVRYIDMGEVEFRYTIRPFVESTTVESTAQGDDFRTMLWKDAITLNRPAMLSLESSHDGGSNPLPREYCGATVTTTTTPSSVQTAVMKFAEDGNGVIIRLFETAGKKTSATVQIPVLATESSISSFNIEMRPHEVKTFRVDSEFVEFIEFIELT